MTTRTRLLLLHADALYLLVAASSGLLNDILGIFFARGPVDTIIALTPGRDRLRGSARARLHHRACCGTPPGARWHLTAVAVHVLLGSANLVFWQMFIAAECSRRLRDDDLHALFAVLQLGAAAMAVRSATVLTTGALLRDQPGNRSPRLR